MEGLVSSLKHLRTERVLDIEVELPGKTAGNISDAGRALRACGANNLIGGQASQLTGNIGLVLCELVEHDED